MHETHKEGAAAPEQKSLKAAPRHLRNRRITAAGVITLTAVLSLLRYVGVFGGNIHAVVAGQVYRSAQLSGSDLQNLLDTRAIRTVVNLRGPRQGDPAYHEEVSICRNKGIRHTDIRLSAVRLPPPAELKRLLAEFSEAPRPLLVHCAGGSDRSGLASVIFLVTQVHIPLDEALAKELTWRYGHLSFGRAHAMDDFFNLYRRSAADLDLASWIKVRYPQLYAQQSI
jgi:protein tyrosine phosphatase (PTP) superfamily phosphohydrolase (DUF442 family)